ncbi:MAG: phosphatidylserine decarboxylase [Planctomycetota bacterium]|jgi:phosphatidylserine decarboxylase
MARFYPGLAILPAVSTPFLRASSHLTGWLADRWLPRFLRAPLYRSFARLYGADLADARGPLEIYPSFGAFFVRRLIDGARPIASGPEELASPVDGTVQTICSIEQGQVLQAKGRSYTTDELLGGMGADLDLEGGTAWTIYLGPKDYHRIHTPEACQLSSARWLGGARYSVDPKVLLRRQVLSINERCVLRLETERGPLLLVLVGALNVGRIRVLGIAPLEERQDLDPPRPFERGEELARFELGSTIVLLAPKGGPTPDASLAPGQSVRLGQSIGAWS